MTSEEGRALVEAWKESGLGPSAFCHRQGVTLNRLTYWRRRGPTTDFIEAVVEDTPAEENGPASVGDIEVVVGDTFVRFPDRPGMAQEVLSALMREQS